MRTVPEANEFLRVWGGGEFRGRGVVILVPGHSSALLLLSVRP